MSTVGTVILLLTAVSPLLLHRYVPVPVLIVLSVVQVLVLAGTFAGRIRGYVLTEREITVQRGMWNTRLPLAGLRSVAGDVEAMRGSLRLFGNGGLFSYTGEFWNSRLKRYRALATDPDRAVVLRYPKRTIVITPHDPQQFIMRARTLIKTAEFR